MQDNDNRISRIDDLRAIAILLVFSDHFYVALFGSIGYGWHGLWHHWNDSPSILSCLFRCTIFDGALGVSLFFIISGLCIRLAQIKARDYLISHFYWRRFWRIYPPYLISLLLFVLVLHCDDLKNIFAHLFLVHNFSSVYFASINRPFWSLALEVQVYLLYPVLCLMHKRWGAARTGLFLLLLSAGSSVIGGETFRNHVHLPALMLAKQMPTRLWFTWYLGFLLAEAMTANLRPSRSSRAVLAVAFLLWPLIKSYRPLMPLETALSGVILALLTWEYLAARFDTGLASRCLACLGICSYSFYLYFDQLIGPILNVLSTYGHISSTVLRCSIGYPITLLAIFVFSYLAYRVIELGSVSLGRKLFLRIRSRTADGKAAPNLSSQ